MNLTSLRIRSRERLINQLARSLDDAAVLEALRHVPREAFVPDELRALAYCNVPLAIGHEQTISQPLMVATSASALQLRGDENVLEVGAGSGYQAAVLAELLPFGTVTAVERIPELATMAHQNLARCRIANVAVLLVEHALGALERGPYDAILVSAAAPSIPDALVAQLKPGGRIVAPVGGREKQTLVRLTVTADSHLIESLGQCRYVPLIGDGAWPSDNS